MRDLLGVQDVHAGRRAGYIEALSVIGQGSGMQTIDLGGLRSARSSPLIREMTVVGESTRRVETCWVGPLVAYRAADVLQGEGSQELRILQDLSSLLVRDGRDDKVIVL